MARTPLETLGRVHGTTVHKRRVQVIVRFLSELIPHAARVLDVGSGDGQVASLLMREREDLVVEGVDVLLRPDAAIPTHAFDGTTLPFGDDEYDVVMMIDVLHHTEEQERLLSECARVARTAVVLKDHYRRGLGANATLRFMDWVGNRAHGVALPYRYLSPQQWERLLERVGLTVEEEREHLGLYPRPWTWLFDRSLHLIARLGHRG
jgi:SAM-dependent methyltransferase